MARTNVTAAIDVGTSKICTIVGQMGEGHEVQITGVGIAPSRGLRKGMVVNVDATAEAIRLSVERAERSSGTRILSAYVGITGNHISSLNNRGVVAISHHDRLVSHEDVARVIETARTLNIPSNREILHVLPRNYVLDGQDGIANPVGLHGFRLDVDTYIITGSVTSIQNLTKCIQQIGVAVEDLVLEPLAGGEAVLTEEEKQMGVALVDIGSGTSEIAIFVQGDLCYTSVISIGGYQFTHDIVYGLGAPFSSAEETKKQHGHANPAEVDPEEYVEVECFGAEGRRPVLRRHLSEIIRARAEELLELIWVDIQRSGYHSVLPAGLVLAGGTANLQGFPSVASRLLKLPVRVGVPRDIYGLVDAVYDPSYATGVGLLLWGLKHGEYDRKERITRFSIADTFKRLAFWVRDLIPY